MKSSPLHHLLFLGFAACALVPTHAQTPVSGALKKGTATKTSDDGAATKIAPVKGIKHAIGVSEFTNEAGYAAWSALGGNLKYMLESALAETGRFVMVERISLGTVVAEQDLQQSGRASTAKNVAETGKLRSAKYVATGALTEISENTSGDGGGIGFGGFKIGAGGTKSSIVLVVKIIDTTSGEQVASKRIRGEAGKSGLTLGVAGIKGVDANFGSFAKTPLGQATQDCINSAVLFIGEAMQKTTIESTVVVISNEEVVIAMGENYGIEVGQKLLVRKDGEILKDPDTGAILDRLEGKTTGTIEVVRTREKTAYCKVIDGTMPVRGDRVVLQ
ncbi:MAG: hypothetical protein RLZZ15_3701 [Verrucomicrobiota bacterium]